jgi:hypothetical protein
MLLRSAYSPSEGLPMVWLLPTNRPLAVAWRAIGRPCKPYSCFGGGLTSAERLGGARRGVKSGDLRGGPTQSLRILTTRWASLVLGLGRT